MNKRPVFSDEELPEFSKSGMPEPLIQGDIEGIEETFYSDFHTRNIVCVVYDEICPEFEAKNFKIDEVPTSFFKDLKAPSVRMGKYLCCLMNFLNSMLQVSTSLKISVCKISFYHVVKDGTISIPFGIAKKLAFTIHLQIYWLSQRFAA